MQEKSLFPVDEAKQFFEKHMSSSLATRSTRDKNGFIPGDFTVDWTTVAYSVDHTHCNIELTINGQYRFRVLRAEEINGVITAYSAPVYQKLVMVKNVKSDMISHYMMTLIPDRRYDQTHKNFDPQTFSVYGDHTGFSGLIIYSTQENTSVSKAVLDILTSQLTIQDNPDLGRNANGTYDPNKDQISNKDFDSPNLARTLLEELTHALQDQTYPNGIAGYGHDSSIGQNSPGFCDIEFEAPMIKEAYDVANGNDVWGFGFASDNDDVNVDLSGLVIAGAIPGVCDGSTLYDDFLDDFTSANPYYDSKSDPNLDMQVFDQVIK